jgi:N-acetylmuramoyl-L-alanine amidase
MCRERKSIFMKLILCALVLSALGCKSKPKVADMRSLPDLNEQIRTFATIENTRVRTGPGPQFRVLAEIPRDAKITAVGRDGDWLLIVSKKGNAPGFIAMASVRAWEGDAREAAASASGAPRSGEEKYQTIADTPLRSGPGLQYPVVTDLTKGTRIEVVENDQGWLRIESKKGNKPGYVDASFARPAEIQ